jgi:hypothetical protein
VATPNELVTAFAKCIETTCVDMNRWGELIRLHFFRSSGRCRTKPRYTRQPAGKLGESLEARGHHSKAALVYAECAKHLLDAKHPSASIFLCNCGLAWKRDKDWEKGEVFYAARTFSMILTLSVITKGSLTASSTCGCAGKIQRILTVRRIS